MDGIPSSMLLLFDQQVAVLKKSRTCLPGVLRSSLFVSIPLQTRPLLALAQGPRPSPAASVLTRAGNGLEETERNRFTSPSTYRLHEGSLFLPTTSGPQVCLKGSLTSLECVLFWCLARSEAFEKALLQPSCSQTYGFSPV